MQDIYLILGAVVVIGIIYIYAISKGKIQQTSPDYRMFFYMGLIFLPIGISNSPLFILSLVFIAIGLVNKDKWKPEQKWSEMPPAQRNLKIGVMVVLGLLIIGGFVMWYLESQQPKEEITPQSLKCLPEQRNVDACIEIYQPVCATVQIQCITTPCDPIQETFSNSCFACRNPLVNSYIEGECPSS